MATNESWREEVNEIIEKFSADNVTSKPFNPETITLEWEGRMGGMEGLYKLVFDTYGYTKTSYIAVGCCRWVDIHLMIYGETRTMELTKGELLSYAFLTYSKMFYDGIPSEDEAKQIIAIIKFFNDNRDNYALELREKMSKQEGVIFKKIDK